MLDPVSLKLRHWLEPAKTDMLHDVLAHGNTGIVMGTEAGCVYTFALDAPGRGLTCHDAVRFQRRGALVGEQDLLVIPSEDGYVQAFDLGKGTVTQPQSSVDLGGTGNGYIVRDTPEGHVWVVSNLLNDQILMVGADARHPEVLGNVIQTRQGLGAGSLHVVGHAQSDHLWADFPINPDGMIAASVLVLDKNDLDAPARLLNVAELAEIPGDVRVLHPQFNRRGNEVWLTVWTQQDETSYIVVLNDDDLTLKHTIKDWRVITPVRTFSLAAKAGL